MSFYYYYIRQEKISEETMDTLSPKRPKLEHTVGETSSASAPTTATTIHDQTPIASSSSPVNVKNGFPSNSSAAASPAASNTEPTTPSSPRTTKISKKV